MLRSDSLAITVKRANNYCYWEIVVSYVYETYCNINTSTFSVIDAMIACGLDNITRYISNTPVQRLPDGLINNDFQSCSDKSKKKFLDD